MPAQRLPPLSRGTTYRIDDQGRIQSENGMRHKDSSLANKVLFPALVVWSILTLGTSTTVGQQAAKDSRVGNLPPLPVKYLQVQGLRRAVRFYQPKSLADHPALLLALHGSKGDGARFRRFTNGAFERLADEYGFLLAYPDALGGQWNDCRTSAAYHTALAGVDDIAFLHAVARRAAEMAGSELAGVFAVGYSNGGHLLFRAAFERPREFTALAVIGAHLPVPEENDCHPPARKAVSIFFVSGTDDPVNPWAGGEVQIPGGGSPGHVLSAEASAEHFWKLAGAPETPTVETHPDRDTADGATVETRRWVARGPIEVVLMVVQGGGHTLPHPTAKFPAQFVGHTSRDLNGAKVIWEFFARRMPPN